MAKKRTAETEALPLRPSDPNGNLPEETPTRAAEPPQAPTATFRSEAGDADKKLPAFKVGPIPTDRNNSVSCVVWENEVQASDGRTFKVHSVAVEASCRDADDHWKPTKGFRGSQLYAVLYCLQKASDFILSQQDPANDCPF